MAGGEEGLTRTTKSSRRSKRTTPPRHNPCHRSSSIHHHHPPAKILLYLHRIPKTQRLALLDVGFPAGGDSFPKENSHTREEEVDGYAYCNVLHKALYLQVLENGKKKSVGPKLWQRSVSKCARHLKQGLLCLSPRLCILPFDALETTHKACQRGRGWSPTAGKIWKSAQWSSGPSCRENSVPLRFARSTTRTALPARIQMCHDAAAVVVPPLMTATFVQSAIHLARSNVTHEDAVG